MFCTFLWIFFVVCILCLPLLYCLLCYLQSCDHLLEKGLPICSLACDVFLCLCHFPIWCPGSGVELNSIDFCSLLFSILCSVLIYIKFNTQNKLSHHRDTSFYGIPKRLPRWHALMYGPVKHSFHPHPAVAFSQGQSYQLSPHMNGPENKHSSSQAKGTKSILFYTKWTLCPWVTGLRIKLSHFHQANHTSSHHTGMSLKIIIHFKCAY